MGKLFPTGLKLGIKIRIPGSIVSIDMPEDIPIEMTGIEKVAKDIWCLEFRSKLGEAGYMKIKGSVEELKMIAALINEVM